MMQYIMFGFIIGAIFIAAVVIAAGAFFVMKSNDKIRKMEEQLKAGSKEVKES